MKKGYRIQVVSKTLLKSDFETILVDGKSKKPLELRKKARGNNCFYHVELNIIEADGTVWHMHGLLFHRKATGILRQKGISEATKERLRKVMEEWNEAKPRGRTKK